ncbi:hypothetical protein KFL_004050070 [Klebsormidium nitens]|uniref:Macro domain-containing protein n=1 Tax=Klebsormidium nitens TaxID=105231 RepID=A0A1Y1IDX4_KLENI|nr:hypothetical protein KFL_004050070 [Klebsormidium nitens]|eukprot:GAQ88162.1 hypothetical protein KFL_004050070 [Klebsormidium nitens]
MQFSHPPENPPPVEDNAALLDFNDVDLIAKQAALLADFEAKRLSVSPAQLKTPIKRGNERRLVAQNGFVQNGTLPRSPPGSASHGPKLPLMLILGGPPGSGKSTFSDALVRQADVPWTRVCQDIAAGGARGTRQQCLKQAKNALLSQRCVIIDRCNIDRDQRADFVALAKSMRIPVHALFLDLPFQLVVQRAAARVGHEGGVEGAMAEGIIRRFIRTKEMPSLLEGFTSVRVCKTDMDVQTAFNEYKTIGTGGTAHAVRQQGPFSDGAVRDFGVPEIGSRPFEGQTDNQSAREGAFGAAASAGDTRPFWGGRNGGFGDDVSTGGARGRTESGFGGASRNGGSYVVDDPMDIDAPERRGISAEPAELSHGGSASDAGKVNGKRKIDDASNGFSTRGGGDGGERASGEPGQGFTNGGDGERVSLGNGRAAPSFRGGAESSGAGGALETPGKASSSEGAGSHPACFRLAFPSISTADFMFDHERAADVIVDEVSAFLERTRADLHLMLVDLSGESDIVRRVRGAAERKGLDFGAGKRFEIRGADITKLRTGGAPESQVLANATNWRLKPGGGGVNASIYSAAGRAFVQATKAQGESLAPGAALPVELPPASPLRSQEGVTHVIHVLGPNMNPQRPNCLNGDYEAGVRLLRQAYRALFETFSSLASGRGSEPGERREGAGERRGVTEGENLRKGLGTDRGSEGFERGVKEASLEAGPSRAEAKGSAEKGKPVNAFAIMMQSAKKRESSGGAKGTEDGKKTRTEGNPVARESAPSAKPDAKPGAKPEATPSRGGGGWAGKGGWSEALRDVALRPDRHQDEVLDEEGGAVVIKDLYHKAKVHYLVLACADGLDTPYDLGREHLSLLEQMVKLGRRWAARASESDPDLRFRFGFHTEPSMRQVHLHVISQDFESEHLKNKKHWNSFTTPFFRDATAVIAEIETDGQLSRPTADATDGLLKKELRCHRCRCVQPNIPRLKAHIRACDAPLPGEVVSSSDVVGTVD